MTGISRSLVKRLAVVGVLACPGSAFVAPIVSSSSRHRLIVNPNQQQSATVSSHTTTTTQRPMSSSSTGAPPDIKHVNREQMEEIVEDFHEGGREESGYCVIDVRTDQEVLMTGKLAESVPTLPVQTIMQAQVFQLEPDEFEQVCGFRKPDLDETLVFTCAAGVRSVYACQFAAQAGYSKLVNYAGGANEWFGPPSQF